MRTERERNACATFFGLSFDYGLKIIFPLNNLFDSLPNCVRADTRGKNNASELTTSRVPRECLPGFQIIWTSGFVRKAETIFSNP